MLIQRLICCWSKVPVGRPLLKIPANGSAFYIWNRVKVYAFGGRFGCGQVDEEEKTFHLCYNNISWFINSIWPGHKVDWAGNVNCGNPWTIVLFHPSGRVNIWNSNVATILSAFAIIPTTHCHTHQTCDHCYTSPWSELVFYAAP